MLSDITLYECLTKFSGNKTVASWCLEKLFDTNILANLCEVRCRLPSGRTGCGACTIIHPASWNMRSWWQGLSGLAITRPGPIKLNVPSICMGLGSEKLIWCKRIPFCDKWRRIHSIPIWLVTWDGKICNNFWHVWRITLLSETMALIMVVIEQTTKLRKSTCLFDERQLFLFDRHVGFQGRK